MLASCALFMETAETTGLFPTSTSTPRSLAKKNVSALIGSNFPARVSRY